MWKVLYNIHAEIIKSLAKQIKVAGTQYQFLVFRSLNSNRERNCMLQSNSLLKFPPEFTAAVINKWIDFNLSHRLLKTWQAKRKGQTSCNLMVEENGKAEIIYLILMYMWNRHMLCRGHCALQLQCSVPQAFPTQPLFLLCIQMFWDTFWKVFFLFSCSVQFFSNHDIMDIMDDRHSSAPSPYN